MKCYSAIKRNEVFIHATTSRNLENIMLSERSQWQRTTCYMFPFMCVFQNRQIHGERKYMGGCIRARERGGGKWGVTDNG